MSDVKEGIEALCIEVLQVAMDASKFKDRKPDYHGKDKKEFLELLRRQTMAEEKLYRVLLARRTEREEFIAKLYLDNAKTYMRQNTGRPFTREFRIGEPTGSYPKAKKEKRRKS